MMKVKLAALVAYFFVAIIIIIFSLLINGVGSAKPKPKQGQKQQQLVSYNSEDPTQAVDIEVPQVEQAQNKTSKGMHHLMKFIFDNYDKELMPTRPVFVKLDVLLLKVKSTVEKEGIFESVIALFIEWQDQRMTWDPAEYDNVSVLAFDSEKVWLPDIAMTNSADHLYGISRDTRFVVRVTSDGVFKFVPTGTAKTWCELNLLTFPFDIQTCSLEFESWSLDSSTMAFNETANIIVDHNFLSTQWTLCNSSAVVYNVYYEFSGETFSRVKYDFTVRRKSTFYLVNLVFPCATLSAIQLLVFAIPSMDCSSDRIGFGTTNLLSLVVFQTIVTSEMPKTSDAVTVLSKYIIALIILSAVGIFESVCVERMHRITEQAPPKWLIKLARHFPLIWRSKSIPDYPNNFLVEDLETNNNNNNGNHLSPNGGTEVLSSQRNSNLPIVAHLQDTDVDHVNSTKMVLQLVPSGGAGTESPPGPLSRSSSANQSHNFTARRLNLGRRISRFTAAKDQRARQEFIETQHAEMWAEIATRLDILSFILSTISAIAVPLALFLPLLYYGNDDCGQAQIDPHKT